MTRPNPLRLTQRLSSLVGALLFGAIVWIGASDLFKIIQRGVIPNRRGPDLSLDDAPVLFWALVAVFGAGLAICTGLSLLCVSMTVRKSIGRPNDEARPHD